MFKISFLAPATHIEEVKLAMFESGAGEIGNYKHCAWQVLGEGQFMPSDQSNPFIGDKEKLNKVSEYYVEMICTTDKIQSVIKAMKEAHPYEEPAYHVIKMENY